jgi:hypothetical protein
MQDKRILHGKLMNDHRAIVNEISDIKGENFELNEDQKKQVEKLENQLKFIAEKLYRLYM